MLPKSGVIECKLSSILVSEAWPRATQPCITFSIIPVMQGIRIHYVKLIPMVAKLADQHLPTAEWEAN